MKDLAGKINLWLKHYHEDLSFNSSGVCYLQVDKQLSIALSLSMDRRFLLVYCPIAGVSKTSDLPLALEALSLNLYQDIAVRGVLGYDDQTNNLVYTLVVEDQPDGQLELAEESFYLLLNGFITNSQMLMQRFHQLQNMVTKTALPSSSRPTSTLSTHFNGRG